MKVGWGVEGKEAQMSIEISGNQNTIQVEKADRIVVTGNGNKIVVKESQKKLAEHNCERRMNTVTYKRSRTGIRGWIWV